MRQHKPINMSPKHQAAFSLQVYAGELKFTRTILQAGHYSSGEQDGRQDDHKTQPVEVPPAV